MNAPALRPRSLGEILDTAFQLYRSRWKEMALATGVLVMPLLLLEAIAPWGFMPLLEWLSNLVFMAAGAAVVVITAGAYRGTDVDAVDAIQAVGSRFFSVWGAAIIQGVVVGIGFLMLVVPGILFLAITFAMQQAVMIEGKSAGEAFTRSRELADGSYRFILATSVMAFIIFIAAVIGFGTVMDEVITSPRLALLITNVLLIGLNPFASVVGTVLYFDLRIRKEAYDVAVATERLGQGVPAPAM